VTDLLFKLRVLRGLLRYQYETWLSEVWRKDLDDYYCCSGRECGCYGSTVRDVYEGTK
jgi:hypothetical protein